MFWQEESLAINTSLGRFMNLFGELPQQVEDSTLRVVIRPQGLAKRVQRGKIARVTTDMCNLLYGTAAILVQTVKRWDDES